MCTDPQFAQPDGSAVDPGRHQSEDDQISVVADDSADIDPDDEYEAL